MSDMPKFHACGMGVVPNYKGTDFNHQFREWQRMRSWCNKQGWEICVDYFAPAKIPDGCWYFKDKEQQVLFVLRWS